MPSRLKSLMVPALFLGLPLTFVVLWGSGSLYHRVAPGTIPPAEAAERVSVDVMPVRLADARATVALAGTVRAEHRAVLGSKLLASLVSAPVEEGDRVKAGQTLALLDARDLEARVAEADGGLARARAATSAAAESIRAADQALAQAQARSALAETTYRRVRALHQDGSTPDQALSEAEAQRAMAKADLEQARRQRQAAVARKSEAQAALRQSEAGLNLAETTRAYARIVAPFDGLVVRKWSEAGTLVSPGTPIVELERRPFRLEVSVEEGLASRLKAGAAVPVALEGGQLALSGRVSQIVPAVDPRTRTAVVKIRLPDHPAVRSGMYGRAQLPAGQSQRLWVPKGAVVQWYHLTSAFVVGPEDRAVLRLVRLGEEAGDRFEVLSGLEPGDRLIVSPGADLRDGQAVEVRS